MGSREGGCQTIGESFFSFYQKIKDDKARWQTVGDAPSQPFSSVFLSQQISISQKSSIRHGVWFLNLGRLVVLQYFLPVLKIRASTLQKLPSWELRPFAWDHQKPQILIGILSSNPAAAASFTAVYEAHSELRPFAWDHQKPPKGFCQATQQQLHLSPLYMKLIHLVPAPAHCSHCRSWPCLAWNESSFCLRIIVTTRTTSTSYILWHITPDQVHLFRAITPSTHHTRPWMLQTDQEQAAVAGFQRAGPFGSNQQVSNSSLPPCQIRSWIWKLLTPFYKL
jgi:hypothetical protein